MRQKRLPALRQKFVQLLVRQRRRLQHGFQMHLHLLAHHSPLWHSSRKRRLCLLRMPRRLHQSLLLHQSLSPVSLLHQTQQTFLK